MAGAGAQSSPRPAPRSGPQSAPGAPRPIQRELSRLTLYTMRIDTSIKSAASEDKIGTEATADAE